MSELPPSASLPDPEPDLSRPSAPTQPLWQQWLDTLAKFPWHSTALTLRARFREDQLSLIASSLTFTTVLALVPFMAVVLAVFAAVPLFARFQEVLQKWLVDNLIPEGIAQPVLDSLNTFASQASSLGLVGFSALLVTAIALTLTIDRTLNNIWRVRRMRPLAQRLVIYWAAITLGPLLFGVSLALTSYALSASRGLVDTLPAGLRVLFNSVEIFILAGSMATLFRYVPNTLVRWRHALVGGIFVALCMQVAKKILAWYLAAVPTYSVVYGTFATVPILLIWIYVAWVIVLLGAVVTAYLPSLLAGVERRPSVHGWHFLLATEVLQQLDNARPQSRRWLYLSEISRRLRVDVLQLHPVIDTLLALDWVAALDEGPYRQAQEPRFLLLADPQSTALEPLLDCLLMERSAALEPLWQRAQLEQLTLADLLTTQPNSVVNHSA